MQHLTLPDRLEVSFLTKDHIVPRGSHFEFRPRYNAYFSSFFNCKAANRICTCGKLTWLTMSLQEDVQKMQLRNQILREFA